MQRSIQLARQKFLSSFCTFVLDNFFAYLVLSLLCVLFCMSAPAFFKLLFSNDFNPFQYSSITFIVLTAAVGFFAIPVFFRTIILKKDLASLGLVAPADGAKALKGAGLIFMACIPFLLLMATEKQFHDYYTFQQVSTIKLILINLTLFPTYYLAEEFFFRGFMLMALWEKIGWHAIWLTEVVFFLAHLGKPGVELAISIPIGILLSVLALRTKSIYPPLCVHFLLGMSNVVLVNYGVIPVIW